MTIIRCAGCGGLALLTHGCRACSALSCEACVAKAGGACPCCRSEVFAGRSFARRLRAVPDWRSLLPRSPHEDFDAPARTLTLLASVPSEALGELNDALGPGARSRFWEEVLDLDLHRRVGDLDYHSDSFALRELRWEAGFPDRIATAAAWYLARAPRRDAESLRERELLLGLRLLSRSLWPEGLAFMLQMASNADDPASRTQALDTLSRWEPSFIDVASFLCPALRADDPKQRAAAFEVFAHLAHFSTTHDHDPLGQRVVALIADALPRANDEALARIIDRTPKTYAFVPILRELGLMEAALDAFADALGAGETDDWIVRWARSLGAAPPAALPWLLSALEKRTSHLPMEEAQAFLAIGSSARAAIPAFDARAASETAFVGNVAAALALRAVHAPEDAATTQLARRLRAHIASGPSFDRLRALGFALDLPAQGQRRTFGDEDPADIAAAILELESTLVSTRVLARHPELLKSARLRAALRRLLPPEPWKTRDESLQQLVEPWDESRIAPVLETFADRDTAPFARERLLEFVATLARAPAGPAATALVDVFIDPSEDARLRIRAAESLHDLGFATSHFARLEVAASDRRAIVRAWAVALVGGVRPSRVSTLVEDPSPLVQFVARTWLARAHDA